MTTTDRFPTKRLHLLVLLVFGLPAMSAFANPTGGDVVSGQAAIQAQGSTLTVTTATNKSIIDWQTFSIAPNEITRFVQPSTASSVLNRVLANEPSLLLGSLQSNGKVFLINPYGILVGAGAHIDVAAFVASTLNISNQDFLSDNLNFQAVLNAGKVDNQGNIRTPEGGTVYLIAPEVENGGIIQTPGGQTILAAGQTVQLMDTATPGVTVEITGADTHATNLGQIMADAGTIGMAGAMVRNSGTLDASSVVREGGRIFLKASTVDLPGTLKATGATQGGSVGVQSDVIFQTGAIEANGDSGGAISLQGNHILQAGTISVLGSGAQGGSISVVADSALIQAAFASIDASGATQGGSIALTTPNGLAFLSGTSQANGAQGGTIHVLGQDIMLATTTLDASGSNQGGTVLVGGDYQGSNPAIQNAQTVTVNPYTQINVSAETQGNGGKAVVWSDQHTIFGGNILARGGATSGDGGQVEVSGKELLGFGGAVDAGASNGNPGSLLLDPKNITIDAVSGPTYLALLDPNPAAGDSYGNGQVLELSNGNLVIASPLDDFGASNAGAVFLFDPTGGLLSTLTGSTANDNVGTSGVTQLTNGNFVVNSPLWNNGTPVSFVGAVTWGSATTGVSGPVSASNSLVGAAATDEVGSGGITALSNGNYVVSSYQWNNTGGSGANGAGAVTWANGDGSTVGAVTASNSLVGTTTNDNVGINGVTEVTDSTHTFDNYVVSSSGWNNGGVSGAGAVTWVDGSNGIAFGESTVGAAVTASNSLVGSSTNDSVGVGVTALSNGNYVVNSYNWTIPGSRIVPDIASVGAVTWADGSTGIAGAVSIDNSLVGSVTNDKVGIGGITALSNGNYVVNSYNWNNGTPLDVGAVTWADGSSGIAFGESTVGATVTASNSLVGSTQFDEVGRGGITELSNGNYVVNSPFWNNGATLSVGAVTWAKNDGSTVGAVSIGNSLYGGNANDEVGSDGITALTGNGNYVVDSSGWNNGTGAVTWGDGTNGTTGAVSTGNSLVGSVSGASGDNVGSGGITALSNGNYVVDSLEWNNGAETQAGAVTWGNGSGGTVGAVSALNSLVGSTAGDSVGGGPGDGSPIGDVEALTNGNYVVNSTFWNNGAVVDAGAVTWGNGSTAGPRLVGAVSSSNSLVGSTANDNVGSGGISALTNGNYVVISSPWDNGAVVDAGAVTWGNGSTGTVGVVSTGNSLVGSTANDNVGSGGISALTNGNYVVRSTNWNNGVATFAGAVTWVDGSNGFVFGENTTGVAVSISNSLVGSAANDSIGSRGITTLANGDYVVSSSSFNSSTGRIDLGYGNGGPDGSIGNVNDPFSTALGSDYTLTSFVLTSLLYTGTAVILQANNDITVNSAITVNNPSGNGGNLTLQAGRSILLNADITTDNGDLSLTANDNAATLADRADTSAGNISIASGVTIDTGTGAFAAAIQTLSTSGSFNNLGTLNVGGVSFITGGVSINNNGTININSGTLSIGVGGADTGDYNIASGATLAFLGGTRNIDSFSTLSGAGNITFSGGTTNLNTSVNYNVTGAITASGGTANFDATDDSSPPVNISASSLTVNGGIINFIGNDLTTPTLNLSSGTLGGTGTVTLTGSGSTWSGGTLGDGGTLSIGNEADLTINGNVTFANHIINNDGLLTWSSGTIDNQAGNLLTNTGTFDIQANTSWFNSTSVVATLNNSGSITRTVGTGTADLRATLNNDGTVNVSSGTLKIDQSGADTGSYTISNSAATLEFAGGTRLLDTNSDITGPGTLTVSGGTVNVRDSLGIAASGTVSVSGGTLDIDTTGAGVTFANTLTLSGGILSGADNLTNQGTMTANNATIDSSFTNTGSLTLTGNSSFNGATFDFNSGSVDINSLTTLTKNGGAFNWNGGALSGPGSLSLTGGASFNIGGSGNKVLSNLTLATSDLTLASGSLDLQSGGVLNATGTTTISPNTTITVSSGTFNPNGVLDNSGTVSGATSFGSLVNSGSYSGALNGGSVTNTGTGSITTSGGTISGALDNSATLDLVSAGILTLAGGGNNSGTINLATGSNLGVSANTFSLLAGSDINGPGNFNISGGTLSADATTAIDSTLNLSSGSITGVGNLTTNGTFNWTGGSISGSGTLTTTGPSAISGTSTKTLGRQWINTDVATISGGNLTLDSGATNSGSGSMTVDTEVTVNNGNIWQNDGTITLQNASIIHLPNVGGYATFSNNGVLNIDSTAGWSFLSDSGIQGGIVNNAGTINVNHNTSWEAAFTNFSSGHLNIAAGDFLSMQNGQTIAGTVDIGAGGTLWVSERHGVNAAFNSTTITGTGTLQVAAGLGPVADLTSVNAAGATLLVGAGGTVNLLDSNSVFANLTMSGGTLAGSSFMVNGGLNYTGGSLNIPLLLASGSNSTLSSVTLAGTGAITNQGTLNLANSTLSGNLDNQGALNVSAGTSSVNGTLTQSGTIDVASGATFQKSGGFTNTGTLSGFGTIDVGTGTLVNNGTVAPGASPGILTITGNYTQGPTGLLAIELGGLTPGSGYDVLNVSGIASLGGTLDVTLFGGFLPTPGNSFTVINASSVTGTFATTNLPSGYIFVTSYGPNFFGLDLPFASSLIPGTISGQPLVGIQSIAGPFYGVTVINAPPISGTTDSPVILASIQDLFIPVDSPFTAGLFGTADTGSEGGGGFGFDVGVAANSRLPVATNIPFPLFYAQVSDEEDKQPDGRVLRRPFGACSTGGGL